nr:xylulose kinase-1 [Tanacetum cinerariifolium]
MIAYLTKSNASEGFNQIIDFLNGSSIKYALTVNPNIYVSCIKQFWTSVAVKKVNDVMRLQALVDKKKVIITEASIRDALHLDDAKGKGFSRVDTPLFEGMLIAHEVGEDVDEVHDEGVPAAGIVVEGAASDDVNAAVDEPSIPSPPPPTQSPPPSQDIPSTSQDVGISIVLLQNLLDTCTTLTRRVEHLEQDKIAQALKITKLKSRVKKLEGRNKLSKLKRLKKVGTSQRTDTSDDTVMDDVSKQEGIIAHIDADEDVVLDDAKDVVVEKSADVDESADVQGGQQKPTELQEVVDVVTTAKIITKVVTAASTTLTVATLQLTIVDAPTLTTAPSTVRRRKGVVIRGPQETATPSTIIHSEAKSKDKGKGILVEEPKPLKKQAQIKQDEKYARELEAELNKNIDWDEVIDHVQRKQKEDKAMDYFKGMTYDDIRPIFEKHFDSNVAFLQNTKEQMDEEDSRALKRMNESQEDKAAKKQKLDEEVEELKRHLQIVPNKEDDVYIEATPLALKVPVVDYEIYNENNKPYYKIKRADGSHQLYLSFLSLLRNFDREDLEALWRLVKERFATTKPKNFSDDFLLITLGAMFEKPDLQAQI